MNLAERLQRRVIARLGGVFNQHFRVAEDMIDGRAQIMTQLGQGRLFDQVSEAISIQMSSGRHRVISARSGAKHIDLALL